jgi:hypothetical protein
MPHEEPTIQDTPQGAPAQETAIQAPQPPSFEPAIAQEDEWLQEDEELPRRPRRRLLTPVPLALLGVLLIACGFIGGVLVEKGQTSSGSTSAAASGLAARFAALRGAGAGAGGSTSGASAAAGAFASRAGGAGGAGFGGATSGTLAYLSGSTLYVTTGEGNTVKVTTSPATSVTKTVKANVQAIRPGETVTAIGATGADGAVTAESIRVGAGAGAGASFGGSGAGGARRAGSGGSASGGGEPALFGGG